MSSEEGPCEPDREARIGAIRTPRDLTDVLRDVSEAMYQEPDEWCHSDVPGLVGTMTTLSEMLADCVDGRPPDAMALQRFAASIVENASWAPLF